MINNNVRYKNKVVFVKFISTLLPKKKKKLSLSCACTIVVIILLLYNMLRGELFIRDDRIEFVLRILSTNEKKAPINIQMNGEKNYSL